MRYGSLLNLLSETNLKEDIEIYRGYQNSFPNLSTKQKKVRLGLRPTTCFSAMIQVWNMQSNTKEKSVSEDV